MDQSEGSIERPGIPFGAEHQMKIVEKLTACLIAVDYVDLILIGARVGCCNPHAEEGAIQNWAFGRNQVDETRFLTPHASTTTHCPQRIIVMAGLKRARPRSTPPPLGRAERETT